MSEHSGSKYDGLYKAMFENSPEALLLITRDGIIEAVNQCFCDTYAYQSAELISCNIKDIIHPDWYDIFDNYMGMITFSEQFQLDCQILHHYDEPVVVSLRANTIKYNHKTAIIIWIKTASQSKDAIPFLMPNDDYYSRVFTLVPEAIAILDGRDGRYLHVNDRFIAMTGYPLAEIIGHTSLELSLWADIREYDLLFRQLMQSGEVHDFEARHINKNGEFRYFLISARTMTAYGKIYFLSVSTDVTDYKSVEEKIRQQNRQLHNAYEELAASYAEIEASAAEIEESRQRLNESELLYRAIFENTGTACLIIDEYMRVLLVNQEFVSWSGYNREELERCKNALELVAPQDRKRLQDYHNRRRNNIDEPPAKYECAYIIKNGEIRQSLNTITMIPGTQQSIVSIIDITEQRGLENELRTMATVDYLTGIYNRRTIMERGNGEYERAKRYMQPLSVLMMDIDHFKFVNDRYGHAGGDQALCDMVATCRQWLRTHDILGRMGGEEFLVLLPHTSINETMVVADRLRQKIAEMIIEFHGSAFSITVSIGVSEVMPQDNSIEMAINRADRALYTAKQNGRNRVELEL